MTPSKKKKGKKRVNVFLFLFCLPKLSTFFLILALNLEVRSAERK